MSVSNIGVLALAEDIHDVKHPVDFPPNYTVFFLLLVLLLFGGVVAASYFLRKEFSQQSWFRSLVGPSEPVDSRLPWQIACEQLEDLQKTNLLSEGNFKEYYSRLSDIVRHYFENQFQIRAPEMTTEEFLWSLEHAQRFPSPKRQIFKDFLNSCDMVKFAKYAPRIQEAEESFRLARCLIEETK